MNRFFAPRHWLWARGGSSFRSASARLVSTEAGFSPRPFTPPHGLSSCDDRPGGINAPGLRLRNSSAGFPGPFGLATPFLSAVRERRGRSPPKTRCRFRQRNPVTGSVDRRSPSGLSPLGVVALGQLPATGACLACGPISLRSPPALRCVHCTSGSSFQVRYRPRGLLSVEPLGTIPMMYPGALSVNGKIT